MAGFDNDVIYGINADYSNALGGTGASTTGQLLTNGQIWIGATAVNAGGTNINVGTLTSPDSSITFGFSSPNITATVTGGSTSVIKLTGNSGVATPSAGNINVITANTTVKFVGAGSTLTQDFNPGNLAIGSSMPAVTVGTGNVGIGGASLSHLTSGTLNCCGGLNSGANITTGSTNTYWGEASGSSTSTSSGNSGFGHNALTNLTLATNATDFNCAFGNLCLNNLSAGVQNNAFGGQSLQQITTGSFGIAFGFQAGVNHTGGDSSNIDIGNLGVNAQSNTINIGTQGSGNAQQNACFIAGITGVTVTSAAVVTLNTATGQLGQVASVNNGVLTTGTTGTPVITPLTANGQVIIGSGSGAPIAATLTPGTGVSITNAANSITVSATGGAFAWVDATSATQTMAIQTGYVTDHTNVTYTLPATAALGDQIRVVGKLGLATIAQNAGQQILMSSASSTVGLTGSIVATNVGDCVWLVCITAGASTVWRGESFVGNWTVN